MAVKIDDPWNRGASPPRLGVPSLRVPRRDVSDTGGAGERERPLRSS